MANFHLISTFDYELFGDGSGCAKHCLLNPIEKVLEISEQYEVPQTFFVDFLEFAALKEASQNNHRLGDHYDDVEIQLKSFVGSRHNIQLHLHPQWLNAKTNQTDWDLDFSKWRIGDLDKTTLKQSIDAGFSYAESLGLLEDPRFCKVFRAGGWAIQPEASVIEALSARGILMDSTVAPGAYNWARGDWFNFLGAPKNKPHWKAADNVCKENPNGSLVEVPIATQTISRSSHVKALKEHRSTPSFPCNCTGSYNGPNSKLQSLIGKLSKILNIGTVMLDTSTLPSWALKEATESYMARFKHLDADIPIVTIGHNKNFSDTSTENFADYISWLADHPDITFSDYTRWGAAAL